MKIKHAFDLKMTGKNALGKKKKKPNSGPAGK